MATKDEVPGGVVHPMDPKWLSEFLSMHKIDAAALKCLLAALKNYNNAVYKAGKQFELDLKKCLKPHVGVKKPPTKK
jgi:hypothetical protein